MARMNKGSVWNRQQGFTLVEMMVSLMLGLLVTAGVISLFIASKDNYNDNERLARIQENARTALFFLNNDLRHTNFWGTLVARSSSIGNPLPLALTADSSLANCATWANNIASEQLIATNSPAGTAACPGAVGSEIKSGTTVLMIKRVGSGDDLDYGVDTASSLQYFLRTNSTNGTLLREGTPPGTAADASGELTDWVYQPKIYFLRPYTTTVGDGIPSLCVVRGNPTLATECLVEGVEFLHIEFGIDSNGDGVPENYSASPTLPEMRDAVTANIYILMRDRTPDFNYQNTNTYQLGGRTPITVNDNFHRAVYSTTAIIQNQRTLPIR